MRQLPGTFPLLSALTALFFVCAALAPAQTDEERRREALKSLPYVAWTEKEVDEAEHGVTVHDSLRAWDGYTLCVDKTRAAIVDMEGEVVHSWDNPASARLQHVRLTEGGHAYMGVSRKGVFELDRDGETVWSCEALVHHDFEIDADGDVLAIVYDEVVIPEFGDSPVLSDKIARLERNGSVTDVWRLHEHRDDLRRWCDQIGGDGTSEDSSVYDWSHMNTLEIIGEPGEIRFSTDLESVGRAADVGSATAGHGAAGSGNRHPAFRPGRVLICLRNLDFIGVVDLGSGDIVWGWGPGEVDHPHQPTLLPNGNILLFDNGYFRGWSRVIEYDPVADEIVWEYKEDDPYDFFSRGRGACQKLPNGNVLVTESAEGRVFEIAPEGDVVWSFLNPSRKGDRRGTFYRAFRYDRGAVDEALATRGQ
ncbi:MAG: hypothetical protein GF400_11725 [Candidatus Eisenbacteria bacterium]|nr:hypothetical protein [Candidatus Eisenbacteria bacterium]